MVCVVCMFKFFKLTLCEAYPGFPPPSPDKTVHVVVKTPVMDFQQPLLLYSFIHIESCCDVMYVKDTLHIYL